MNSKYGKRVNSISHWQPGEMSLSLSLLFLQCFVFSSCCAVFLWLSTHGLVLRAAALPRTCPPLHACLVGTRGVWLEWSHSGLQPPCGSLLAQRGARLIVPPNSMMSTSGSNRAEASAKAILVQNQRSDLGSKSLKVTRFI